MNFMPPNLQHARTCESQKLNQCAAKDNAVPETVASIAKALLIGLQCTRRRGRVATHTGSRNKNLNTHTPRISSVRAIKETKRESKAYQTNVRANAVHKALERIDLDTVKLLLRRRVDEISTNRDKRWSSLVDRIDGVLKRSGFSLPAGSPTRVLLSFGGFSSKTRSRQLQGNPNHTMRVSDCSFPVSLRMEKDLHVHTNKCAPA